MNSPVYLSVIVPVYNEQDRLERCIEELMPHVTKYLYEILIVDNGSDDNTRSIAKTASVAYPHVHYHRLNDRGKGLAIRHGMLLAKGRYRYMCDVDLSTPAKEIHLFIEKARIYDLVIGSRELDKTTVTTTQKRRVIGRIFHALVQDLAPRIQDTQCGFKMFRDEAAERIFENCRINGMAFDVEAIYLARMCGYRIHEMPVTWKHDDNSRVRLLEDSLEMLFDVLSLYWRRFPVPHKAV